jgi:hypothetical protein
MPRNRSTLLPLLGFAAVFGVLEAAVVVDLRRLVDPGGTLFPLVSIPADLVLVERVREAATLLLLALAAHLAGHDAKSRFASLLVVFGAWDIVYYVALRFFVGWPQGLGTWDLLFLLPRAWYGPVYAPIVVAIVMIVCGVAALRRLERGLVLPVGRRHVAGAAIGGTIVIASFLLPTPQEVLLHRYRIELLIVGLGIGIAAYADLLRASRHVARMPFSVSATTHSEPQSADASSSGGAPTSTARVRGGSPPRAGG